jgi:hypothetical protein
VDGGHDSMELPVGRSMGQGIPGRLEENTMRRGA